MPLDSVGPWLDALCELYAPEEVGDILSTKDSAEPGHVSCVWSATAIDVIAVASAGWASGSLADQKAAWPDGSDLTVGGRAAYYSPGLFLDELFVEVDAGVLWLVASGIRRGCRGRGDRPRGAGGLAFRIVAASSVTRPGPPWTPPAGIRSCGSTYTGPWPRRSWHSPIVQGGVDQASVL